MQDHYPDPYHGAPPRIGRLCHTPYTGYPPPGHHTTAAVPTTLSRPTTVHQASSGYSGWPKIANCLKWWFLEVQNGGVKTVNFGKKAYLNLIVFGKIVKNGTF